MALGMAAGRRSVRVTTLLGLDLGTTGARAVLADTSGAVRFSREVAYPLRTPHPGWAEQDPDGWEHAAFDALASAAAAAPDRSGIAAIGLTGQMHGATLLDARDRPVRPAIIWCDQRTAPQRRAMEAQIGLPEIIARTGNPPLEGFTAPKLLWVRDHEPAVHARIRRLLLPKDFIRLRLTGAALTDVADASGTGLFDVRRRTWSEAMLRDLDLPRTWLADVVESPAVAGRLTADAARRLDLPPGTPVAAGAGDQAAGAVAAGIVAPGDAVVTIGSSGVVFAATAAPQIDPAGRVHTFCHAVPAMWEVMGVTQGAGLSLRWFRDTLAGDVRADVPQRGLDPYELLTREAATAPPGSRGLVWLPYLQGERTPHLDASARGVLFGLTTAHARSDVVRAIMEGVACSLRDCLQIIRGLGIRSDAVKIAGGGARSPVWRQIVADVLDVALVIVAEGRGPAFGAALLAGVAGGVWGSVPEACAACRLEGERLDPIAAHRRRYDDLYGVYRDLYPALQPLFGRVAAPQAPLEAREARDPPGAPSPWHP